MDPMCELINDGESSIVSTVQVLGGRDQMLRGAASTPLSCGLLTQAQQ